jgi:hypothetical protein
MDKFDRFWQANEVSDVCVGVQNVFGRWGLFAIDNADIILEVCALMRSIGKPITPELLAVTWLNETTFRFYSEPNKNNSEDFNKWDVGPLQINVGVLKANLANKFISLDKVNLNIEQVLGSNSGSNLFNGNPEANIVCAAVILHRIGQGAIVEGKERKLMFPALTAQAWAVMPEGLKNERRAVAYTGPEARSYRLKSYRVFAPMFRKFFEIYQATN